MTYGMVHMHSEHSLNDGVMTIAEMVRRAKEMGISAITLTDHGTCTGLINFLKETKKHGIKGIPGVEAYVKSDVTDKRCHMVLLAKNKKGYQNISKAVSLSNYHIDNSVPRYSFPMMDKSIIEECFGDGNVIATTACVAGIAGQILLHNYYIDLEIQKLKKRQKKYTSSQDNKEYEVILNGKNEKEEKLNELRKKRRELEKIAEKDYSKREIAANAMFEFVRDEILAEIALEKEESNKAKIEIIELDNEIATENEYLSKFKTVLSKMEKQFNKFQEIEDKINSLMENKYPDTVLIEKAKKELAWYKNIFKDDFYIELQYHGLEMEKIVYPQMAKLAKVMNIPVIATNDAHMAYKEDISKREFLRSLRYNEWESASKSDKELYMKSDEELALFISKIIDKDTVREAISNIRVLCDSCEEIDLMHESHYPKYFDIHSDKVIPSADLLRIKTEENAKKLFPDGLPKEYRERMDYELNVIIDMGFADYLLIVADYVNYGKELAINNNEWKTGYGIGPGRGSGCGSIVNYFLGITSLDPMKYGLLFERFLNQERVTMPDIDVDFSKEVREKCIQYVTDKYGKECVAAITTRLTQAAKASVHNAARLLGDKESHDKGKYLSLGNKIAKEIPFAPKTTFSSQMDNGQTVKNHLLTVFSDDKAAKEIIDMAVSTEGAMTSLGIHAAGIVITDGKPVYDYVPVCYMENTGMAVQCDKYEVEEIGCLKMDFLGLKNLDIISETLRQVKKRYNVSLDMDNLPQEQAVYQNIFAKGNTDSVFQFESQGMKKMLMDFKPDCFEDIILLVAAYRPGPMQYLDGIIKIKNGMKSPKYLCKELEDILGNTYAAIIYQEQVMMIFQKLAGYSLGGADIVRRYMSKKNMDLLAKEKETFVYGNDTIKGCVKNGIPEKVALELFDQMTDFAKYAFNKSHAAAYAFIAYQTAYLKYYYPKEYMSAVLSYTIFDKLFDLSLECKRMNIPLLLPDINRACYEFMPVDEGIMYGFLGIKGTGQLGKKIVEEREKGRFTSFQDFLVRVRPKKNEAEALIMAGCFDSMYPKQRTELLHVLPELTELYGKIEKKTELIKKKQEETREIDSRIENKDGKLSVLKKEKKKLERSLEQHEKDLKKLNASWKQLTVLNSYDEPEVLEKEREVLGAYVSGHILDYYKHIYTPDITLYKDFKNGKLTVAGVIRNVRKVKGYYFFLLDDPTGTYNISVFKPEGFEDLLHEGSVVKIWGKGERERIDDDLYKITVIALKIDSCKRDNKTIIIDIPEPSVFYSRQFQTFFASFIDPNGPSVLVVDKNRGTVLKLKSRINPDILNIRIPIKGVIVHT